MISLKLQNFKLFLKIYFLLTSHIDYHYIQGKEKPPPSATRVFKILFTNSSSLGTTGTSSWWLWTVKSSRISGTCRIFKSTTLDDRPSTQDESLDEIRVTFFLSYIASIFSFYIWELNVLCINL